jgi:hypothetical protein
MELRQYTIAGRQILISGVEQLEADAAGFVAFIISIQVVTAAFEEQGRGVVEDVGDKKLPNQVAKRQTAHIPARSVISPVLAIVVKF